MTEIIKVKTDYKDGLDITPGKVYEAEVIGESVPTYGRLLEIVDDLGCTVISVEKQSAHLGDEDWQEVFDGDDSGIDL